MASRVKKEALPESGGRVHTAWQLPDDLLKFSFKYFTTTTKFGCAAVPEEARERYWPAVLQRLKDASALTIKEFRTNKAKAWRAHTHDWAHTSEPDGFTSLNPQLRQCEPWQFQIDAHHYGRAHGFILDDVFYLIWIDPQHLLYPAE